MDECSFIKVSNKDSFNIKIERYSILMLYNKNSKKLLTL